MQHLLLSRQILTGRLFLLMAMLLCLLPFSLRAEPVAFLGQLDLKGLEREDFQQPVPLRGDWSLAQGLLLLPEDWLLLQSTTGEAIFGQGESFRSLETAGASLSTEQSTWQLEVVLPVDAPPLALVVPPMRDAWQVFVNGQPFLSAGQPGMMAGDEQPSRARTRMRQLPPGQSNLIITLQLSRHLSGERAGPAALPYLVHQVVASQSENRMVAGHFMVVGLVLALGLASGLMWLGRQREIGYLWFSLLLANAALYLLFANDMMHRILPDLPEHYQVRLVVVPCFVALALLVPFYNQYCRYAGIAPKGTFSAKPLLLAGWVYASLLFAAAITSGILPLVHIVRMVDWLPVAAIPVVLWSALAVFRAFVDKLPGARFAMVGGILLVLAVIYDILMHYSDTGETTALFPVGLSAFVISHAIAIARRYESAYVLAESENRLLRRNNAALENRVGQDRLLLDKSSRDLVRLATQDEATGLYTRPWFMRRASREFKRARRFNRPMAFAVVQIDRYAALLAEKGEEQSAIVIQEILRRLQSVMRDTDISGLAGEGNIGLIMPETSFEDAGDLCALMQVVMRREAIGYSSDDQPVTVSIAVTALTDFDLDISSMSIRLDRALEELTAAGGDGVSIRTGMQLTSEGG